MSCIWDPAKHLEGNFLSENIERLTVNSYFCKKLTVHSFLCNSDDF